MWEDVFTSSFFKLNYISIKNLKMKKLSSLAIPEAEIQFNKPINKKPEE
jgi:hypothetical protein